MGRMCMRATIVAATVFLVALGTTAQAPGGSLRGIVEDGERARVASATITIRLNASSLERTVHCDSEGNFRIDDLKPGIYRVIVRAQGFAEAQADIPIAESSVRDIAVTMKPLAVNQTIDVLAQSSSITTQAMDLASQVHQSVISGQDLEELPLPARSFRFDCNSHCSNRSHSRNSVLSSRS